MSRGTPTRRAWIASGEGGRTPATSRQITAVAANVSVAGPTGAPSRVCSGAR